MATNEELRAAAERERNLILDAINFGIERPQQRELLSVLDDYLAANDSTPVDYDWLEETLGTGDETICLSQRSGVLVLTCDDGESEFLVSGRSRADVLALLKWLCVKTKEPTP